jgi:20S proteasome alpha/beta subunit
MTLIAAFRASKGGVLLCSDRHEDDGVSKRSVDKVYRINHLKSCHVFMAGAGPSTPIKNAFIEIHKSLKQQEDSGLEVAWEHREAIENSLKSIYERYEDVLQNWPMNLIIVIAPHAKNYTPMLYSTDGKMLSPEGSYVTHGSGKGVADYLASRLYSEDLMTKWLVIMAAFIFREAGESSSGVGFGSNMILINNEGQGRREIGHIPVSEVEHILPLLVNCLHEHWTRIDATTGFPTWLNND